MNLEEEKYSKYALCREMVEAATILGNFNPEITREFASFIQTRPKVFITGEGSSRIFPAKHSIYQALSNGLNVEIMTEGARQAMEYILGNFIVFGLSNSGKTSELIQLFNHLNNIHHPYFFGITATKDSPVELIPQKSIILSCGIEKAVPATKSVMEEAFFFDSLLCNLTDSKLPNLDQLSKNILYTLGIPIDRKIIEAFCKAPIIYFAGRNDGVAEELTLKTNEITHKKSIFL